MVKYHASIEIVYHPNGTIPNKPKSANVAILGSGESKREFITGGYGGNYCVFDGQWRLLSKGNRLVDCRQLPAEKPAEKGDKEADLARVRLEKVMQSLPK